MEPGGKDGQAIAVAQGTCRVNNYLMPARVFAAHRHAKNFEGRRPSMTVPEFSEDRPPAG